MDGKAAGEQWPVAGPAVNELGTYFRHDFSSAGEKCNMSARVPPTPTGGISLRISHRFLLIADEVIGRPGTNLLVSVTMSLWW